jgi:hypothetical protein
MLLAAGPAMDAPGAEVRQNATAPPEGRANREPGELSPNEVVGMLDAQYGTFVGRLKALQETRRKNQRARNQLVQDLRRLTVPQVTTLDEAAVRDRLKALRELDDRSAADLRRAYDSLDEVLDLRQQARFRIFEETIERRKMDLLMRARQRAARRGGTQ